MTILGISAFYHDSAAAIVKDGEIIAAAQEDGYPEKTRPRIPGQCDPVVPGICGLRPGRARRRRILR